MVADKGDAMTIEPMRTLFCPKALCVLLGGLAWSASLALADSPASPLPSTVFDWETRVARPTEVGQWRDVTDGPTRALRRLECHITTLNPGLASHPQHQHAQEEFIILKEGELDVVINGKARRAGPGALFFYASNDFHSVVNVGDAPATYLVFNYETEKTRDAPKAPAAESAPSGSLASGVYDWESPQSERSAGRQVRRLFEAPTVTASKLRCDAVTLSADTRADEGGPAGAEALVVVMEGQIEATVGGAATEIGPGSIVFFASGEPRALRNAGAGNASYYMVRIATEATPES